MVLIKSVVALAAALAATSVAANTIKASKRRFVGCYDAPTTFSMGRSDIFMSSGSCVETCLKEGNAIAATVDERCYCGDELPPLSTSNDDRKCDLPCPGYEGEVCGSDDGKYWSFWSTGLMKDIVNESEDFAASNAASITSATSAVPKPTASTVTGLFPEKLAVMGCYVAPLSYYNGRASKFKAHGVCIESCVRIGYALAGMENNECHCVQGLPDSDKKVDDSKCDVPCASVPTDMCGSKDGKYWTLVATGEMEVVSDSEFDNKWGYDTSVTVSTVTVSTVTGTEASSSSTITTAPSGSATSEPTNDTATTTTLTGAANQGNTYQVGRLVAAFFGLAMAL